MQYLYAPWRGSYAKKHHSLSNTSESPFTALFKEQNDKDTYILCRLTYTGIILNQYPYNPGHLLIIPYRQVGRLDALSHAERYELMEAVNHSISILEQIAENSGTNVGLNLGDKASGGSILNHLHMHVIPRWHGDTSFLPLTANTKVLSEDLNIVYRNLLKPFSELSIDIPESL